MRDIISAYEIDHEREHDGYESLLNSIRESFDHVTLKDDPLFTTDAGDLYEIFLRNLPAEAQQHYNCNACQHFMNRYGGLVQIMPSGDLRPIMWQLSVPDFFRPAVNAVSAKVMAAKVTGVFIPADRKLGTPVTGSWHHMAVKVPHYMVHKDKLRSAYQKAAEKAEDHRLLCTAIGAYDKDTVKTAVNLLRSHMFYRSERALHMLEWLLRVHEAIEGVYGRWLSNLLWLETAKAPEGYCHIGGTVAGTLLDDIKAGYDVETLRRRFAEKMDPLQYQRPQAAPTKGNVDQAEKIVQKLGLERSLRRRFARLDEIPKLWTPAPAQEKKTAAGVFSGLRTKNEAAQVKTIVIPPTVTMTWEKFKRTVLPYAEKIEYRVPNSLNSYSAIVTAADMDAPPIIRWDREDDRCPFNWYVYRGGSLPSAWNLDSGWAKVTGVAMQPSLARPGYESHGKSVFFFLDGCKDRNYKTAGLALFPETLIPELREARATIEAFSRQGRLEGYEEASACGVRLQEGIDWNHVIKVHTSTGETAYRLDRWD